MLQERKTDIWGQGGRSKLWHSESSELSVELIKTDTELRHYVTRQEKGGGQYQSVVIHITVWKWMGTSSQAGPKMTAKGIIHPKQKQNYSVPNEWGHQSILTFLFKTIHWLLNCQTHHFVHDSITRKKTKSGVFTCVGGGNFIGCYKHHLVRKAQHGRTTFFVFSQAGLIWPWGNMPPKTTSLIWPWSDMGVDVLRRDQLTVDTHLHNLQYLQQNTQTKTMRKHMERYKYYTPAISAWNTMHSYAKGPGWMQM
jgi:hypothetical protein